ncbi:hypothetical protein FOA52_013448 [Chlamydomonas sp. UWO 241]|nr:hypothetical protein FOA52_013448 [Chlamydomonas sp. UWO 241]
MLCAARRVIPSAASGSLRHRLAPRIIPQRTADRSIAMKSGQKTVLVPVADGSEEMEAVITINVLRRAGSLVTVASVMPGSLQVKCARGTNIVADCMIAECANQTFDLIALPGGMPGAEHLRDCAELEAMVRAQKDAGRLYAALCATPVVFLQVKGLLADGAKATAHPAFSGKLPDQSVVPERVVVDGNLTTSRGPGTSFEFALSLVKQLYGAEKEKEVAGPMVMYPY